ncbi:MAG: hypothetical protein IJU43_09110 [Lachnospiraceae bacterium]|nr:hypothetical protein [Lachnospiraceae bacterium]
MDEKLKLSDDALEGVAGGVSFDWGQQKSKKPMKMDMICPRCGGTVHQEFFPDGSVRYKTCPNIDKSGKVCGNPLGEG